MEAFDFVWRHITDTADAFVKGEGFLILMAAFLSMVVAERLIAMFGHTRVWDPKDTLSNVISQSFVAVFQTVAFGGAFFACYLLMYEHLRIWTIPFTWWGWVLVFLINDLIYYTDHRMAHRVGFLWALHVSHHSSQEMNCLVANRGSALNIGRLIQPAYFLLPIMGVQPGMWLAVVFFAGLWGIFNHTRLVHRMGFLENWMITPANHRVHHGTEPKYLDRNYAQVFAFWDRLFGTFKREEEEPTYGLVTQMNSHKLWDIQTWGVQVLVRNIRQAPRWQDKLMYLIQPPGWRHDGRHETTEILVAAQASLGPTPAQHGAQNSTVGNLLAGQRHTH